MGLSKRKDLAPQVELSKKGQSKRKDFVSQGSFRKWVCLKGKTLLRKWSFQKRVNLKGKTLLPKGSFRKWVFRKGKTLLPLVYLKVKTLLPIEAKPFLLNRTIFEKRQNHISLLLPLSRNKVTQERSQSKNTTILKYL